MVTAIVCAGCMIDDGLKKYFPGDPIELDELEIDRLEGMGKIRRHQASDGAQTSKQTGGQAAKTGSEDLAPPREYSPEIEAALAAYYNGEVTRGQIPTVEALGKRLGRDLTATERDAIWEKALNVLPSE